MSKMYVTGGKTHDGAGNRVGSGKQPGFKGTRPGTAKPMPDKKKRTTTSKKTTASGATVKKA